MKIKIEHHGSGPSVTVKQVTAQLYAGNIVLLRVETDDKWLKGQLQRTDFGGDQSFSFMFFRDSQRGMVTEVTFEAENEREQGLLNNGRVLEYGRTYGVTAYIFPREPYSCDDMEELACYINPTEEPKCGST